MQKCSQEANCAIKLTVLDQFSQTRVGQQKQRTVLLTTTFSLIGRPNRWSVLLGKPAEIGRIFLIGMGSQTFGSGFLSLRVERVLFVGDAPRPPRKCLFCVQMNRPLSPFRKRANAKKLQNAQTLYAKRAGIEGTVAQAVRTCEIRRARYIGSKKLRLQAFLTATAMNVLRACEWLMRGKHTSTHISRSANLVATGKYAAAA